MINWSMKNHHCYVAIWTEEKEMEIKQKYIYLLPPTMYPKIRKEFQPTWSVNCTEMALVPQTLCITFCGSKLFTTLFCLDNL